MSKSQEVELKSKEHQALTEELLSKQATQFNCLRAAAAMLTNLLKDIGEIGVAIGDESLKVLPNNNGKLEEEFTVTRLYISKIKFIVKVLVQRYQGLESSQADCNKKVSEYEKELGQCRLLILQHETRMRTLSEAMKEAEACKRALHEDVDAMHEEFAKLKSAEQVQSVSNKEKADEKKAATKMRLALEEQMDQLRDAHQKQAHQ